MTFFLLSFLILVGIWAVFIEPNHIKVEKLFLEIKKLPPSFQSLKILHLSDFHFKKLGQKEKKVLEILNQLNPNFIFITGDIIDGRTKDFESCYKFLEELSKNHEGKIFAVYGNHDYQNKNFNLLKNSLEKNKIKVLENESVILRRNGGFIYPVRESSISNGVYLIGVGDPHLGYDNIEKATKGIESNAPKILLAHSPEIFRKVKEKNIDLVLVGHTHGGQVNIPLLRELTLPLKYDKKYKSGLFKEGSIYLYVNRGIGETLLPIRINAFPEITLIKLK